MKTLQPDVLRTYISKLDDFAEFEETDKAFALVMASPRISDALAFLVAWPRLDLASKLVLDQASKWDGRQHHVLATAADTLSDSHADAATVLYRTLLNDILRRSASDAYLDGATYFVALHELQSKLSALFPFQSHKQYAAELQRIHARKYSFWQILPRDLL